MDTMPEIWPGDFFSTPNNGILGWINSHLTKTSSGKKPTEEHFGVIADPVLDEAGGFVDFETRESVMKGPATLRFYERNQNHNISLYRLPGMTKEEGIRLVRSISQIGTAGYGFIDFLKAAVDVAQLLITMQFPPYTADQFAISAGPAYICTELCAYAARQIGKPVEAPAHPDEWDIPTVYAEAVEQGRLICYYKGKLLPAGAGQEER